MCIYWALLSFIVTWSHLEISYRGGDTAVWKADSIDLMMQFLTVLGKECIKFISWQFYFLIAFFFIIQSFFFKEQ